MASFKFAAVTLALPFQLHPFPHFLVFDWSIQLMLQNYSKPLLCDMLAPRAVRHAFLFQIVIDKVTGNQWSGSIAVGITTKTIPLLAVPASALELRDGTWLMTGSCVMKDAVIIKENYGHSLDRLQVQFFFNFSFLTLEQVPFSANSHCHIKGFRKTKKKKTAALYITVL